MQGNIETLGMELSRLGLGGNFRTPKCPLMALSGPWHFRRGGIAQPMTGVIFYTNPMSLGRIVGWMLEELGPYETRVLDDGPQMNRPTIWPSTLWATCRPCSTGTPW